MRLIKNTTELIGIKDQNIKISLVFETDTHIEIRSKLNYPVPSCPHCQGKMIEYDFQKDSSKLSFRYFYSKAFHQTLTPHELVEKTLDFSDELIDYYTLY